MALNCSRQSVLTAALLLGGLSMTSCGRSAGPAVAQGPPPTVVQIQTLETRPLEQSSEFIATIRSLRSATVQPEVEGLVTRIFVKAGDRVRAGQPLVQINADKQVAAFRSAEASRAGTLADVEYWRQQVSRLEALVEAGAISRQEFDQAKNSLRTAEARLDALDAQVREGRVQLEYYRVDAPLSGRVGEISIRVGDRVTSSTMITTIDENEALEVYIHVPLDRSPDLRPGLPVELLDADGKVIATNPVTFVAPRVDDGTQTVLVKSALDTAPPFIRVQQFVRARIVWSRAPGLTIPMTAVSRISGQYFCFVAEQEPEGLIARQKPVQVGDLIGNDYVVRGGLKAGDRLILSGIQKLRDGAPVRPE
ncbi:MAG TPA: efflux RND transporter periplasmic adaptor subunit [Vicinamibacterales bacterium]|nr:efflux RND transporter periplasmic adaptor subunit [Vicinamibacterales bacterium]